MHPGTVTTPAFLRYSRPEQRCPQDASVFNRTLVHVLFYVRIAQKTYKSRLQQLSRSLLTGHVEQAKWQPRIRQSTKVYRGPSAHVPHNARLQAHGRAVCTSFIFQVRILSMQLITHSGDDNESTNPTKTHCTVQRRTAQCSIVQWSTIQ